ncbi:MAG: efflux RND transporter periplasmic adaptor subunit [Acidobacteriota bacterium]
MLIRDTTDTRERSRCAPLALIGLALIGLGAAASACNTTAEQTDGAGGRGGGRAGRGGGGQSIRVDTATLQHISLERRVDLSGTLVSPDQARVSSEVAGVIREVRIQLGSEVRVGDVLVRLEPRELALALERAESALRQVEAQLGIDRTQDKQPPPDEQIASVRQTMANRDDARAAFERAQQLNGRGLLTRSDRDTAETRLKVTEANYEAAIDNVRSLKASLQDRRASYELAQKKLNDAAIKAPVAGSVAERLVQPGEFIRENTPVATIVQMNPLKLKTAIQEKNAAVIRVGQTVEFVVEAFPTRTFEGKVAFVSPSVDQTTRTFPVEILVENGDRMLKPGFFAKGTVLTHIDQEVLAAPDDAVSAMAGVATVFVIEGGKARQQQVTLGARQGKVVEIVEGLKGPEILATSNVNQLATGTSVRTGADDGGARGDGRGGRQGGGRDGGGGESRGRREGAGQ